MSGFSNRTRRYNACAGSPAFIAACGFTLIEVLVAISVFAVISAGVYRVLSGMVLTQEKVVTHAQSLRELQRAMSVLSADMEQLSPRDIKLPNDDREPALIADVDDYLLVFTRQGVRNPLLLNRSSLQRVAYSLGPDPNPLPEGSAEKRSGDDRHLLRHSWGALDRLDDTAEVVQVLLRDVEEVDIRYLDGKGKWKDDWPETRMNDKAHIRDLPVAVRLTMKTARYGEVERFFQSGNVVHKEVVGSGGNKP